MTDNREALILALAEAGVHPLGRHDVADRLIAAGVTLRSEPTLDEGLREALAFLRKRLVGTPPNVDAEDVWMASVLDEAEAVGRAAVDIPDVVTAAQNREYRRLAQERETP